jgi:hypothetical protein
VSRLGHGKRGRERGSVQGCRSRGIDQDRRRHESPGLHLSHWQHTQVLPRGQEAGSGDQERLCPGPSTSKLRLVREAPPLSILTNFAEFAVYECKKKPDQNDRASTGRIHYWRHTEFSEKWDEIAGIFSKGAILNGSFDRYAEASNRRGTATVDNAFLAQIEEWRANLARNIALRNKGITQRQLNEAVQLTLDRIIFLRICEDRGVEPYGELRHLLSHKDDVYKGLLTICTFRELIGSERESRDRK